MVRLSTSRAICDVLFSSSTWSFRLGIQDNGVHPTTSVVPSLKNVAASRSHRIISARGTFYPDMDTYTRISPTSHVEPLILHTIHSLLCYFDLYIQFTYRHMDHSPATILSDRQDTSRRAPQSVHCVEAAELPLKMMAHAIYVTDRPSKVHQASQTD